MAVPPPLPDPTHIETRLLIVAEMLERAVNEVHRVMTDIKGDTSVALEATDGRSVDDNPTIPPDC